MQKSTPNKYGSVAVTIHWLTALLIVGLLISGNRLDGMTDSAAKAQLLMIHAPVGVLIGLLTVLRIFWWWRFDKKPEPAGTTPAWQERAAQGVHVLFYVVILGMAASGVGMMVQRGGRDNQFGGALLASIGAYLLASNLGWIQVEMWQLWPVAVILLGVAMIRKAVR